MEQYEHFSDMHPDQHRPGLNGHDFILRNRQAPASLLASVMGSLGLESQLEDVGPGALGSRSRHQHTLASLLSDLTGQDWAMRAAAIDALGMLGEQAPLEPLLAALQDEDETVRATALRVLAQRGYSFSPEQRDALQHDPAWHVREIAAFVFPSSIVHEQTALPSQLVKKQDIVAPRSTYTHQQIQTILSSIYGTIRYSFLSRQQRGYAHMQTQDRDTVNIVDIPPADTKPSWLYPVKHGKRRPILRALEGSLAVLIILAITLSWLVVTHHFQPTPSHIGSASRITTALHANLSPIYTDSSNSVGSSNWAWSADSRYLNYTMNSSSANMTTYDFTTKQQFTHVITQLLVSTPVSSSTEQWAENGREILLRAINGTAKAVLAQVWDVPDGRLLFSHSFSVNSSTEQPAMSLSNDGTRLAVVNTNGTVGIWNVQTGLLIPLCQGSPSSSTNTYSDICRSNVGNPANIGQIEWYPDGKHLLIFDKTGMLQVWNTTSGINTFTFNDAAKTCFDAELSPDGKLIALVTGPASSSLSGARTMITMLDAATGKKLTDYKQHHLDWLQPYTILAVQWLPDSRHIITRYALPGNAEFRAWNALTGTTSLEAFTSLDSWEEVLGNGKYLTLGASNGHQATTWNIASGQKLATIDATIVDPGKYTWQGTTFQTQTSLYLASFNGTTITLWNAMTGKPVYSSAFPVGKNAAYMLSWSPDGHYLAAQRSPLSWSANSPNATNTVIQVWKIE